MLSGSETGAFLRVSKFFQEDFTMEKTFKKHKMTAAEKAGFVARMLLLLGGLACMVIGSLMMDLALGWALLGNAIIAAGMVLAWFSFKKV